MAIESNQPEQFLRTSRNYISCKNIRRPPQTMHNTQQHTKIPSFRWYQNFASLSPKESHNNNQRNKKWSQNQFQQNGKVHKISGKREEKRKRKMKCAHIFDSFSVQFIMYIYLIYTVCEFRMHFSFTDFFISLVHITQDNETYTMLFCIAGCLVLRRWPGDNVLVSLVERATDGICYSQKRQSHAVHRNRWNTSSTAMWSIDWFYFAFSIFVRTFGMFFVFDSLAF